MTIPVTLSPEAYRPLRLHDTDAGIDLRAPYGCLIRTGGSARFDTGVRVQLPEGTCGLILPRSGMNILHGILTTGLIDEGYEGTITVMLYNLGAEDYMVYAGDRIAQLVVIPALRPDVAVVDSLPARSDRGAAGIGSTGR